MPLPRRGHQFYRRRRHSPGPEPTSRLNTRAKWLWILHGTADKAARASGSQAFFDAAGSKDKTLKLYEGHVHDLLNDVGREAVMAGVLAWIGTRPRHRFRASARSDMPNEGGCFSSSFSRG